MKGRERQRTKGKGKKVGDWEGGTGSGGLEKRGRAEGEKGKSLGAQPQPEILVPPLSIHAYYTCIGPICLDLCVRIARMPYV